MLAKQNLDIEDAVVTLHELSDDEQIKLQCEARERYERDMASAVAKGKAEGKREGREDGLREGEKIGLRKGKEIGLHEGESKILQLIQHLTAEGQTELISKVTIDSSYREELYKKYGL